MAQVGLHHLSKRYASGSAHAVHDVNLTVEHGELFVLLGPSGCGKSTTLRMIAGLESISAGDLRIDGQVVNAVPAKDRDIAMVFQSYALYPHMSVRDNLAFGLRRRKIERAEIERRVAQAAQTLELEPYLGRKPHALSGGQRQRVALGRAIVRDPKVFLFDEPLSNLDAALRVSTRAELTALHQRLHATMIYVTHDQVEAMTMGTRICIMNGGRVEQVGTPLQVYRKPANTFVAGFLGSPPTNLLPARLDGHSLVLGQQRLAAETLLGRVAPQALSAAQGFTLGIRPEDVSIAADSGLQAEVVSSEALGAETLATFALPGVPVPVRARLGRDAAPQRGERMRIAFDLRCVRLFAADSGRALQHLDD